MRGDLHDDPASRFRRVALATVFGAPVVSGLALSFPVILFDPSLVIRLMILTCAFGWPVGALTGLVFWRPLRAFWLWVVKIGQIRGWSMQADILASLATSLLAVCFALLVLSVGTIVTSDDLRELPPLGDALGFGMIILPPIAFTAAIATAILCRQRVGARA